MFVFYVLLCETDQIVRYSKITRCSKEIKCKLRYDGNKISCFNLDKKESDEAWIDSESLSSL